MTSKKFPEHQYAAVCLNYHGDGTIELQSYNTIVATINPEGWLHINGLYSRTTIKHIGWFMRKLGFSYQLAKQLLTDEMDMNLETGECRKWE